MMEKYLLISSRDPFACAETESLYDLAKGLVRRGDEVTFFLVQNGVLPARKNPKFPVFQDLIRAGVEVFADDFSLQERGILPEALFPGIRRESIDILVDQLLDRRTKAIWH